MKILRFQFHEIYIYLFSILSYSELLNFIFLIRINVTLILRKCHQTNTQEVFTLMCLCLTQKTSVWVHSYLVMLTKFTTVSSVSSILCLYTQSSLSLSLRSPRTLAFHTPHLPLPCLLFTVLLHCAIFWYTGHELMTTPDENCQDEFSGQLPCVIVTKTAFFSHTSQRTITTTCMLLHSVCTFMHH